MVHHPSWKVLQERWLILLVAYLCLILFVQHFWFITDDAYISFRYAKNWAEGGGLRYNPGVDPPVEGFSNFLWMALMAGVHLVGLDMVATAPWISFALAILLVWLVFRYLFEVFGSQDQIPILGIFFLVLFPPFAVWATGGLETMLFALLFFLTFERLPGRVKRPRGYQAGISAGLLALTRPEGVIWGLILGGLYVIRRRQEREPMFDRTLAQYGSIFLFVTACFFAARFLYFERMLPNVVYAKVSLSGLIFKRGIYYVLSHFLTLVTPAILVLLPILLLKRACLAVERRIIWRAYLVIMGFLAYAILTGGDFMAMGRFLVPTAPFFAVLFVAAIKTMKKRGQFTRWIFLSLALACLVIQVLPSFNRHLVPRAVRETLHFRWNSPLACSEYEQWYIMKENAKKWAAAGRVLQEYSSGDGSLVCAYIGALGYYSGLRIYDQCGLVDPSVDEREPVPDRTPKSAGHDKILPAASFLKYQPTYIMILVVKEHQFPKIMESLLDTGLPDSYRIKSLPLKSEETTLAGWTFVFLEHNPADRRDTEVKEGVEISPGDI